MGRRNALVPAVLLVSCLTAGCQETESEPEEPVEE